MKLLLIEDNKPLAEDIQKFLNENGFVTELAGNLSEAREKIQLYQYDLLIIDIGLPDGSGLELIKEIKQSKLNSGILVITAKNAIEDKVQGLELGADDYLTKPFHLAELNARIRSIIRRGKFDGQNALEAGDITIDTLAAQVYLKKEELNLTRKEYDLLLYFVYNRNRILTKESIAEHLWGDHIDQADNFDFIYNHIKNLRKKIIQSGGADCIRSMYGMGYKFSVDN